MLVYAPRHWLQREHGRIQLGIPNLEENRGRKHIIYLKRLSREATSSLRAVAGCDVHALSHGSVHMVQII